MVISFISMEFKWQVVVNESTMLRAGWATSAKKVLKLIKKVSSIWEHVWQLDLNAQVEPLRDLDQTKIKNWPDYPRIILVWIQSYSEHRQLVLSHSYQQIRPMMPLLYKPDRKGREGWDVGVKGCSLNAFMFQQRTKRCTNRRNINMNFYGNDQWSQVVTLDCDTRLINANITAIF